MLRRENRHPAHGGGSDPAFGHIDDPQHGQVVHAVGNGPQIGQNVLDLLALIEVHASHQAIGHVVVYAPLLQKTGLGVGAVEHRLVLVGEAAVPDLPGHIVRLVPCVLKLFEMHQRALAVGRPERLVLPPAVVPDHAVGRV